MRTAAPRRRIERRPRDRAEVVAELRRQPHADVVLAVAVAQLRRHDALDHAAKLTGDAADVEAEVGRHLAVDPRHHLRLAGDERALHVHGAGNAADLGHQLVADPLQLLHVVAADVEVDRRLVGRALHELGIGDANLRERNRRELRRTAALISPRPRARVSFRVSLTCTDEDRTSPCRPTVLNTWRTSGTCPTDLLDAADLRHALVERRARRQIDEDLELAAVFVRHELGADHAEQCRGWPRRSAAPRRAPSTAVPATSAAPGDTGGRACRTGDPALEAAGRCASACAPPAGCSGRTATTASGRA